MPMPMPLPVLMLMPSQRCRRAGDEILSLGLHRSRSQRAALVASEAKASSSSAAAAYCAMRAALIACGADQSTD